jgi:hypothetical protein
MYFSDTIRLISREAADMNSENEILGTIPDGKPVRIFLPKLQTEQRIRAECVFQESLPPKFDLVFKPGILAEEEIDRKHPCIISIDMGGPTLSLEAMIVDIVNPQTLRMRLKRSISHEQMREFFRVDAVTQVIAKSFRSGPGGLPGGGWTIVGQTIDISGSGIRARFSDKIPPDRQVRLELTVPYPEPEVIKVLAQRIRSTQMADGSFEVAYHFNDIASDDRDKIIGCCLTIQRKLLRLRVQVKDSE